MVEKLIKKMLAISLKYIYLDGYNKLEQEKKIDIQMDMYYQSFDEEIRKMEVCFSSSDFALSILTFILRTSLSKKFLKLVGN